MNVRYKISMEDIADKKKAILESTLKLVVEHGFHGTPMSLVAKKANVAAGTIYHYFESKDELICSLYAYNKSRVVATINTALMPGGFSKEIFFKSCTNLYRFYCQNTDVLVFFEQYINSPYNTNKCASPFQGKFYDFFKKGIEQDLLKDLKPEILVVYTLSNIANAAKLNKYGSISFSEADFKNVLIMLWDGITKNLEDKHFNPNDKPSQ